MDKNIEVTLLYDIYGKLLTQKQQSIFEEYYIYNLSLREIAENKNISFQGVRDSIKKSEENLYKLEENIGMLALKRKMLSLKDFILKNKNDLNAVSEDILNKISEVE